MLSYWKYIDTDKLEKAPHVLTKGDLTIYGYDQESNEPMLLEDGYVRYDGNKDKNHIKIVNGKIVEIEDEPIKEKNVYTKLQIRRAMRKLSIEPALDALLERNKEFKADWTDAEMIDFDDEIFKKAFESIQGVSIQQIIDAIEEK